MFELPIGTILGLLLMAVGPVVMFLLYWIDKQTNDGYISVFGAR